MYRSKLQICTEILSNLISNGPMKLSNLSKKVGLEESDLKNHLKLLLNSSIVEKQNFGKNNIFYAATGIGITLLNIYYPLIKEEQKIPRHKFEAISLAL